VNDRTSMRLQVHRTTQDKNTFVSHDLTTFLCRVFTSYAFR